MYIPLEEVESSNLVSIGYHRQTQTLRIRFQGDRYYDYPMVTEREYEALMKAESKGRFFNTRIKPMYGHRMVREETLVKPCCDHPERDTCSEECYPCSEWCCPGPVAAKVADAVKLGLETGQRLTKVISHIAEYTGSDGGTTCDESCECACHEVSPVPPAVPLTDDGEIDVAKIPDVTHLFHEETGELIDGRCRCCNNPIQITPEDAVELCLLCFRGKGGDTDEPCTNDHVTEDSGWCRIRVDDGGEQSESSATGSAKGLVLAGDVQLVDQSESDDGDEAEENLVSQPESD